MAARYWVGGSGTWSTTSTTNWSAAAAVAFTGSYSGFILTTTGSPSLAIGMTVFDANNASLGTITGGANPTWTLSINNGTGASQGMTAATVGASAPTTVDAVTFNSTSGSATTGFTVTLAAAVSAAITITNPVTTGNTLTFAGTTLTPIAGSAVTISSSGGNVVFSNTTFNVNGNLTVSTPTTVAFNCTTFALPNSGSVITVTTNDCSITSAVTLGNSGGSTTLGSNFTTTGSFTITAGQLTITGRTLTCASFVHSGQLVTGTTGVVNITGTSGTVFNIALAAATMTATNSFNLTATPAAGTTRTVSMVASSTAVINLNVLSGSDTIAIPTACNIRNIDFTGFSGDLATTAVVNISGNLTVPNTMTIADAATAISFTGASGTQIITTNSTPIRRVINFSGASTRQLADAFTTTRAITHSAGTLNLNSQTITGLSYANTNTSACVLTFGASGKIYCTGTGTVFSVASTSTFTLTGGISDVYITSTGSTAITAGGVSSGTEAASINFKFTGGTYPLTTGNSVRTLDFTGFSGTLVPVARTIYGNLILSPTMTITASTTLTTTFAGTSGTKTFTTNAKTIPLDLLFSGAGSTWKLLDQMTTGTTNTITHNNGTIDLNGNTFTMNYYITGTGTKNITFNGGTIAISGGTSFSATINSTTVIASTTPPLLSGMQIVTVNGYSNAGVITGGSGTSWTVSVGASGVGPTNWSAGFFQNAVPTGFTTTAGPGGNGFIVFTSSSPKIFVGGGSTYAATIVLASSGQLLILGANTFSSIKNTVVPATVKFQHSLTNTFSDSFKLKGSYGKNVNIGSATSSFVTASATTSSLTITSGAIYGSSGSLVYTASGVYVGAITTGGGPLNTTFGLTGGTGTYSSQAMSVGSPATIARGSYTVSCDFLNLSCNLATPGSNYYAGGHSSIYGNGTTGVTGWINTAPPTANTEFLTLLR